MSNRSSISRSPGYPQPRQPSLATPSAPRSGVGPARARSSGAGAELGAGAGAGALVRARQGDPIPRPASSRAANNHESPRLLTPAGFALASAQLSAKDRWRRLHAILHQIDLAGELLLLQMLAIDPEFYKLFIMRRYVSRAQRATGAKGAEEIGKLYKELRRVGYKYGFTSMPTGKVKRRYT